MRPGLCRESALCQGGAGRPSSTQGATPRSLSRWARGGGWAALVEGSVRFRSSAQALRLHEWRVQAEGLGAWHAVIFGLRCLKFPTLHSSSLVSLSALRRRGCQQAGPLSGVSPVFCKSSLVFPGFGFVSTSPLQLTENGFSLTCLPSFLSLAK